MVCAGGQGRAGGCKVLSNCLQVELKSAKRDRAPCLEESLFQIKQRRSIEITHHCPGIIEMHFAIKKSSQAKRN